MRGRPFEVTWPEEDTSEALKAAYQGERDIDGRGRTLPAKVERPPRGETGGIRHGEIISMESQGGEEE